MQERSIFMAALERETTAERSAFLDAACANDAALRQRVEELLKSHVEAGAFLGKPVAERLAEQLGTPRGTEETLGHQPATDDDGPLEFLAPSDKPEHLGRLGHYEVVEIVGRGGMGIVLRAFDEKLHRVVAIKVMAPQLATSAAARKRFSREAQAAAAVSHDHVVTIHAVEEASGLPYLAMQYVSGMSLQERLDKSGPLKLREIVRIGMQTAAGLAAAHAQGLIHRDIKPANILLENGVERVKITDFGLARAVADASMTQTGMVAGTPQYMSPEQARGEAVDRRSDLFSLGSVLYAMCTGRPPFRADSGIAVLRRVCDDTPRPIRETNPDIPEWLEAVVARLHAKDRGDRYQSAAEVAELLNEHLAHLQHPSVVPLPAVEKPARHVPVRRRLWATAAVLLLCIAAGLGMTEAAGVTKLAASVIRVLTPEGTLIVEVDDPGVSVTVDGDGGLVITGAGPQEVRLRPGSYKLRATKDGKPIPLDKELVTISRGGEQVVRVRLETAAPATGALAAEREAFVRLGGKGVAERKFDTLAEAVQGASDGDTIEIRGNGPFETPPITRHQPLVIRAGDGFKPVIRLAPGSTGSLISSTAALVLEGLELYRQLPLAGNLGELPSEERSGVIQCSAPFAIANCRVIGNGRRMTLQCWGSPAVSVRNCQLMHSGGSLVHWFYQGEGGRLVIDNSILEAVAGPANGAGATAGGANEPRAHSVQITRTTSLVAFGMLQLGWVPALPPENRGDPARPPLRVELAGNVIDSWMPVVEWYCTRAAWEAIQDRTPEQKRALLPQLLAWQERSNLYHLHIQGDNFFRWSLEQPAAAAVETELIPRAEWTTLFKLPGAQSQHVRPRYQGGDLRARLDADPLSLTADDFRLRADSPGYRAGPDGEDLGADIDLVGPGAAYERWKKTPEYQEWRKETGQSK